MTVQDKPDTDEEPCVFVMDASLDENNEWPVDGSWMVLEDIDPPEEVEAMKLVAIEAARARRVERRNSSS